MFRIRQISNQTSVQDKKAVASVLGIYQKAFHYYPEYASKIAKLLQFEERRDFEIILLVAECNKDRVLGFTLCFLFEKENLAYLDYIAADPARRHRGYGTALYEATRE